MRARMKRIILLADSRLSHPGDRLGISRSSRNSAIDASDRYPHAKNAGRELPAVIGIRVVSKRRVAQRPSGHDPCLHRPGSRFERRGRIPSFRPSRRRLRRSGKWKARKAAARGRCGSFPRVLALVILGDAGLLRLQVSRQTRTGRWSLFSTDRYLADFQSVGRGQIPGGLQGAWPISAGRRTWDG